MSSSPSTKQDANTSGAAWHTFSVSDALQYEEVDPMTGLSPAEAEARLQKFGQNVFVPAKKQPGYIRFLHQYRDPMQIVLLVAAIVSMVINEWSTALLLLVLTLFNA